MVDKNTADKDSVHCTNGCYWVGEKGSLDYHLEKECVFVTVECTNKCSALVKKKNLEFHLNRLCPLRQYSCKYCNHRATYRTITTEHYAKCLQYPVDCPNECHGKKFRRGELKRHCAQCQLQPVECPFVDVGCKAVLPRKDLENHISTSTQRHLVAAMETLQSLKSEMWRMQEEERAMKQVMRTDVEIIKQSVGLVQPLAFDSIATQLQDKTVELKDNECVMLRMVDFSEYKRSKRAWTSPEFGDALLVVYANGTGDGAGSHVSIELVNRDAGFSDYEVQLVSEVSLLTTERQLLGRWKMKVCEKFLVHMKLCSYVHNDSLMFRVTRKSLLHMFFNDW